MDLDETLVKSVWYRELFATGKKDSVIRSTSKDGMMLYKAQKLVGKKFLDCNFKIRPYAIEFLKWAHNYFDVVVFTAAE